METVVTELARYVIVILMALYTCFGFTTFSAKKKRRDKICKRQRTVMYLFHFIGYFII